MDDKDDEDEESEKENEESSESRPQNISNSSSKASDDSQTGSSSQSEQELESSNTCIICFERRNSIAFVPCGHRVVCTGCSPGVTSCPVCRAVITGRLKTY